MRNGVAITSSLETGECLALTLYPFGPRIVLISKKKKKKRKGKRPMSCHIATVVNKVHHGP